MNKKNILILSSLLLLGSCFSAYEVMSTLNISNTNISEKTLSGTEVGSLTTNGGTAPYKYTLTGSDSSGFYISGDKLYIGFTPTHIGFATGKNTYDIGITSIDKSEPTLVGDVTSVFNTEGRFYNDGELPNLNAVGGIRPDGSIITRGYDGYGGERSSSFGSAAPTGTGFTQMFSNYMAFAALKADGSITARGHTTWGGAGAPTGTGYTKIASAGESFAALKDDGSIAVWGDPAVGGSGTGPTGTGFVSIMSNRYAYAAIKDDGSIVVRGNSTKGGAGGPAGTGFVKVFGAQNAFAALKADGSIVSRGEAAKGGSGAPSGTGFTKIYGNNYAFAALKADGSIRTRGTSGRGGDAAPAGTGFVQIYGDGSAFAATKADGSITARGHASYGGSGAPTRSGYTKVLGQGNAYAALKDDGSIATRGWAAYGGSGGPSGTGYVDIYGTYQAYAALKDDGSVTSRGVSNYGGTGAPTGTGFVKIISISDTFIGIKNDGTVSAWGGSATDWQNGVVGELIDNIGSKYTQNIGINITAIPLTGTIEYSTTLPTNGNVIATLTGISDDTITNNSGSNQYTFTGNGSFTFNIVDTDGDTGTIIATVNNIDKTAPTATVAYSTTETTQGAVKATITLNETGIITNNSGSNSHVFDQNGTFVFTFNDAVGNTGSIAVTVSWILGKGNGAILEKDNCPNGDTSASYYDKICKPATTTGSTTAENELVTAYKRSYGKKITTMPTIEKARIGDTLTRAEMAKMIVNYAVNNLGKKIDTTKQPSFDDIQGLTQEMQTYINQANQLGLMGIGSTHFNPNGLVTRAEFATVLARLLYNTVSNPNEAYYTKAIETLSQKGVIKDTNPLLQEVRGYVMLMLMRASK